MDDEFFEEVNHETYFQEALLEGLDELEEDGVEFRRARIKKREYAETSGFIRKIEDARKRAAEGRAGFSGTP